MSASHTGIGKSISMYYAKEGMVASLNTLYLNVFYVCTEFAFAYVFFPIQLQHNNLTAFITGCKGITITRRTKKEDKEMVWLLDES